jgi:hypothetical protein
VTELSANPVRGLSRVSVLLCAACLAWISACGGTATDTGRTGKASTGGAGNGGAPTAGPCRLNSECPSALVCMSGLCRAECTESRDCPDGQRCVLSAEGDAAASTPTVCQLIVEARCVYNTDCQAPLVCAADLECRNECAGDRDCVGGQVCVYGVCAEPAEVNPDGTLKGATDAGTGPGKPR